MKRSLLIAASLLMVTAAPAQAGWPTPQLPDPMPTIVWERCPPPNDWVGCTNRDTNTIYVDDHDNLRRVNHELGHVQERRLDQGERNRIIRLFGMRGQAWTAAWGIHSPSEIFADAYAECRVAATVRHWRRAVNRSDCRLIRRALAD